MLKEKNIKIAVLESTGIYHRLAWKILDKNGVSVSIVNPKRIRDFAKSMGILAKTDKLDSQTIAKYGEVVDLKPMAYYSEKEEELQGLLHRREQLIKMQTMEKNRLEKASDTAII